MRRDHIGLGALFALTLAAACGATEGEPSRPTSGRSSNSSSADGDTEDDEQEGAQEEAQDEQVTEEVADEPEAPPPRRADGGAPSAPSTDDDESPATASDAGRPSARDGGRADASVPVVGTSGSGFNAGAGELQADGQTVIYRIPDGTGRSDWNPKDKPIRVKPGMVLRFIDEDTTARGDGHWLHTFGQPCPHSARAIGEGYDCKIRMDAPTGIVPSTLEHSPSNFGGRVYIEVVREGETASAR